MGQTQPKWEKKFIQNCGKETWRVFAVNIEKQIGTPNARKKGDMYC
jgi:hypothetical protein